MKSKFFIFCVIAIIFGSQSKTNRLNVWHIHNLNILDTHKLMIINCRKRAKLLLSKGVEWEPNLEERLICKYNNIKYQEDENELVRDVSLSDLNGSKTETNTYFKDATESIVEVYAGLLLNMFQKNPDYTFNEEGLLDIFNISRNAITECLKRYLLNPEKRNKVNEILQKLETLSCFEEDFYINIKKYFDEIKTEKDFILAVIEYFEKSTLVHVLNLKYLGLKQEIMQAKHHFIKINLKDILQKEKLVGILNKIESYIDKEQSDLHLISLHLLAMNYNGTEDSDLNNTVQTFKFESESDIKDIKKEFLDRVLQKNIKVSFVIANDQVRYELSRYVGENFDKFRVQNTKDIHDTLMRFFFIICDDNSKSIDIILKAEICHENMFKPLQIYFSDSQEVINDGNNFDGF